jgi:hypothetical protein
MAYDEALAARIGAVLADHPEHAADLGEQRMFGGLAFLVRGHMVAAASGQGGLMLRCDPAATDDHVAAGAERMVMRGRAMDGWLRVSDSAVAADEDLARWIAVGLDYVATLPPKRPKSR